jgi:hypothetical protein
MVERRIGVCLLLVVVFKMTTIFRHRGRVKVVVVE